MHKLLCLKVRVTADNIRNEKRRQRQTFGYNWLLLSFTKLSYVVSCNLLKQQVGEVKTKSLNEPVMYSSSKASFVFHKLSHTPKRTTFIIEIITFRHTFTLSFTLRHTSTMWSTLSHKNVSYTLQLKTHVN